jgi:hypothetical protein
VGVTVVDRVIVPENPPRLARVMVEVAEEPRGMVSVTGFAVIEKSGVVPVLKTAVCTVSGSGVGVPLAIVTHVLETLVGGGHPVWKPRGMPEVEPVTL